MMHGNSIITKLLLLLSVLFPYFNHTIVYLGHNITAINYLQSNKSKFLSWSDYEQIEFRDWLMSLASESFVFQAAINKYIY